MKKKWYQVNLPKTYFGFPIEDQHQEGEIKKNAKKRGVALMIAIMMVAIVMTFIADMIVSSSVNLELAASSRDRIKSEYMAKSGANLGLFLNTIDWGMDLFLAGQQQVPMADTSGDIWAAINGMPIGGATAELIEGMSEKFDLGKVRDDKMIDQIKQIDGQFTIDVSDEGSKINLNYCAIGQCFQVRKMIAALLSCPVEKAFLDKKNLDPMQMAARIKDYIDFQSGAEPESGFSDENDPYNDLKYQAKNAPFDTLDELKMVAGWDDEMHAVFSKYFTIYPYQKKAGDKPTLNLNTANQSMLGCLIPSGMSDACKEKFILGMNKLDKDGSPRVTGDIKTAMTELMCYTTADKESGDEDRSSWFKENSRVFKIVSMGQVGNQTKTVEMVIERLDSNEMKARKMSQVYDVLYYKVY